MCGICGALIRDGLSSEELEKLKLDFYQSSCKIKHRGPDRSTSTTLEHPINVIIDFKRLAIMDTSTRGDQPFKYETDDRTVYVTCNGEIYDYKDIVKQEDFKLSSGSDCEVIPCLYKKYGAARMHKICNMLNSEHAFAIHDINMTTGDYILILSSDPYGKRPLFIKSDAKGFYYSSELEGLPNIKDITGNVMRFPPAHYGVIEKKDGKLGEMKFMRYYSPNPTEISSEILVNGGNKFIEYTVHHKMPDQKELTNATIASNMFRPDPGNSQTYQPNVYSYMKGISAALQQDNPLNNEEIAKDTIRTLLTEAVVRRLDSDRPIGSLLSGGLDSSLVSAIIADHLKPLGKKLRTFSIGIRGTDSIDRPYAEMVAKHIGSDHTYVEFTEQEFLDAIPDIVNTTGTYDITTIRASTGQYLISKWISQNTNIKVLFCGDGSDELFQGYLYSFNGPSAQELHKDTIRLIENIHYFDGLRADRCVSRWGMELRIPYLDHTLVDYVLTVDPRIRTPMYKGIEKWILRAAFEKTNLLPREVLFRIKSAFSDAISSRKRSWVDIIKEMAEKKYTAEEFTTALKKYAHLPPISKESLYYRELFCHYFGENESVSKTIPYFWMPQWSNATDPSARVLSVCKEGSYVE